MSTFPRQLTRQLVDFVGRGCSDAIGIPLIGPLSDRARGIGALARGMDTW